MAVKQAPSDPDAKLLAEITAAEGGGEVVRTTLSTDDRVLARVTDGIYREPAAALRELIANAYDADATSISIQTDAPRFARITIRDNGRGMDKEALVHLINHIGGSAKRTYEGSQLGVSDARDPSRSPSGRRLIGKIGIGLFSVSQLTRHFRITTKAKDEPFRLVADVTLNTYSEDKLATKPLKGEERIHTGLVTIQSVRAPDVEYHGTEIDLLELQPAARDLLQSRDIWDRVNSPDDFENDLAPERFEPPPYHCGRLDPKTRNIISHSANLPWDDTDEPAARFRKLHEAVIDEADKRTKPNLQQTLDRYLRTIWLLSLAAPLPYIQGHPFDLTGSADPAFYLLSNDKQGKATRISLKQKQALRSEVRLESGITGGNGPLPFQVFVDGVELFRPIRFGDLPASDVEDPRRRPLMFVGKCKPPVSKMPEEVAGGRELEFEAYFLWTPKVIPTDHNGVLVRIADASGTLFDSSFFGYQVAEFTRLAQITAEIYVKAGLEASLNIDRESFNFGHPHAKIVMSWVHRALRQLATTQKRVTKEEREKRRTTAAKGQSAALRDRVATKLGADDSDLPVVKIVDDEGDLKAARKSGALAFQRDAVFADVPAPKNTEKGKLARRHVEDKIAAIMQVLEAFGLLRNISYARQQELLNAIATILVDAE